MSFSSDHPYEPASLLPSLHINTYTDLFKARAPTRRRRQMVHLLQWSSSSVHIPLIFFTVLLLTSSMAVVAFSDARRLPLRRLVPNKAMAADNNKQEAGARMNWERETEARRRALIGSRPPRCERVCMSCGHCEAVQVPIVPQQEKEKEKASAAAAAAAVTLTAAMFTYRVDGITNYKPLSWKCRCGGTILDP